MPATTVNVNRSADVSAWWSNAKGRVGAEKRQRKGTHTDHSGGHCRAINADVLHALNGVSREQAEYASIDGMVQACVDNLIAPSEVNLMNDDLDASSTRYDNYSLPESTGTDVIPDFPMMIHKDSDVQHSTISIDTLGQGDFDMDFFDLDLLDHDSKFPTTPSGSEFQTYMTPSTKYEEEFTALFQLRACLGNNEQPSETASSRPMYFI